MPNQKFRLLFLYDDPVEPLNLFGDKHVLDFLQYQIGGIYYLHKLVGHEVTFVNNEITNSMDGFQFYTFKEFPGGEFDLVIIWRKITLQIQEVLGKIGYHLATISLCDFGYEKDQEFYKTVQKFLGRSSHHFLSPYMRKTIFRWNISSRFWHEDYICSIFKIKHDRLLPFPRDGIHPGNLGPFSKKPKTILFASNPGRGLKQLVKIFSKLVRKDSEFVLHACVPERARNNKFKTEPKSLLSWLSRKRDHKRALIYNYGPCNNLYYHSYLPPYQQEHWQLFQMCEYLVYLLSFLNHTHVLLRMLEGQAVSYSTLLIWAVLRIT